MLSDELIKDYKKDYNQTFKRKDKDWRQKHGYNGLKHLEFLPDRLHADQLQPDQLKSGKLWLPKWVKVNKERFNEILSIVTEAKSNKLKTSVDKNIITVNRVEELVKDIASKKLNLKKRQKVSLILV